MKRVSRSEIIFPIVTALLGGIGGAFIAMTGHWDSNRQMDVKMVEIAVGILSQEPKENIAPARKWAVDVIAHYSSEVKLSQEVKDALVNFKVVNGWHDNASSADWTATDGSDNWKSKVNPTK